MALKSPVAALFAAGLIASSLAACSSSSSSSSSAAQGTASSAAAGSSASSGSKLSGQPVQIDINYPATGSIPFPQVTTAVRAAQKAINDSGGINGRPLKVDVCDAQSPADPNPTLTCIRTVASNQNIVAEVGDYGSFNDIVTPLENQAHLVQIGGVPLGLSQTTLPNAYPLMASEEEALGTTLVDNGAHKPGLAYIDIPTAQKAFTSINEFLKAGSPGIQLVAKAAAPLTATSLSPQVAALCSASGVGLSLAPTQVAQFLTAHAQGPCAKQTLAAPSLELLPANLKSLGSLAQGVIVDAGLPMMTDTTNPGIKMFKEQMNAIDPSASQDTDSLNAWVSIWAFAQEARLLKGPITRDTVWNQWSQIGSFQVFDLLPPGLNLQHGTSIPGYTRLFNHWVRLGAVQNGVVQYSGKGWVNYAGS